MTSVPKSGDRQIVNDYRPVSVIPIIAKVFESIVHHQVYGYLGTRDSEGGAGWFSNK